MLKKEQKLANSPKKAFENNLHLYLAFANGAGITLLGLGICWLARRKYK